MPSKRSQSRDTLRSTQEVAPLIASIVRDDVVFGLTKEIDVLRGQIRELRNLQITGRHGTPVYAKWQLDENRNFKDLFGNFSLEGCRSCVNSDVQNVEIRMGGKLVACQEFSTVFEINQQERSRTFHITFCPCFITLTFDVQGRIDEPLDPSIFDPHSDRKIECHFRTINIPPTLKLMTNFVLGYIRQLYSPGSISVDPLNIAKIIAENLMNSGEDLLNEENVKEYVELEFESMVW